MTDGHRIDLLLADLVEVVFVAWEAMEAASLLCPSSSPSYRGVAAELDNSGVDSNGSSGVSLLGFLMLPAAERSDDLSEPAILECCDKSALCK